jgi:dienelactone hydrolase
MPQHAKCRSRAAAILSLLFFIALPCRAVIRTIDAPPLDPGPFPVACSDVAYDAAKVAQIGGTPSDYWEGNPVNGVSHYFTEVLAEPNDTITINPVAPNDPSFYPQTANRPVPFVVIVCYPTSVDNTRPDYPLPELLFVPKMQRADDKPIFPPLQLRPIKPGEEDPNLLPLLVLSHGLAGSPLNGNSLEVMSRLASYGYMVAAPFHADARFANIDISNISDLVYVIYHFDQFAEMEALRPVALKATVDAVLAHPDFGPRVNPNRIGGFGASMGGASMIWLLGAEVTSGFFNQHSHPAVQDPRLRAAVGYVPFAGENFLPAFGQDNATAHNVNKPFLAICGTADTVAPIARVEQALSQFQNSNYLVARTGIPHGYNSSYADDVFGWVIPFLDAFVRGDSAARTSFLEQKDIAGGLDDNVVMDTTLPLANYSDSWWNPNESGWGITITDHGSNAFVQWYTYDTSGHNQKYVISGGTFTPDKCQFTGAITHVTGPSWTLPVFDPAVVARTPAGTGTIDFCPVGLPAGTIVFYYTADGVSGSKQATRLVFGNDAPHYGGTANTGGPDYTDLWWNPAESGWGVSVTQHGNNLFFRIFVYDPDPRPLLFRISGGTFNSPASFTGNLQLTTGPYFGSVPFDSTQVVRTSAGTATLAFTDANNGVLAYTVNGVTVTKAITRLSF